MFELIEKSILNFNKAPLVSLALLFAAVIAVTVKLVVREIGKQGNRDK